MTERGKKKQIVGGLTGDETPLMEKISHFPKTQRLQLTDKVYFLYGGVLCRPVNRFSTGLPFTELQGL
jgi:hypothetical protein